MKALRYERGNLHLADVEPPSDPDEALIRVTLSGICNTDLEITRGYAGFEGTLGHEFVGIAETAPGAPHLVGKRVVGEINAGCGECTDCLRGDPRHCPKRTVLGIVGRDGARLRRSDASLGVREGGHCVFPAAVSIALFAGAMAASG